MQGSGYMGQGAGFRVQVTGCRVQGAGFAVLGSGFMVQLREQGHDSEPRRRRSTGLGLQGCRVQGSLRVQGSGCRLQGPGFGVQGAGFRLQGCSSPDLCFSYHFYGPTTDDWSGSVLYQEAPRQCAVNMLQLEDFVSKRIKQFVLERIEHSP